jgi:DNA-binding IclR family transcriptional regulator
MAATPKRKGKAYKVTGLNIMKIFKALKDAAEEGEGFLTVSELARRASLHKWTVSRTLDLYMGTMIEMVQPPELEALGLQVKLVKLADPGMTSQQMINYLKMRSKIKA